MKNNYISAAFEMKILQPKIGNLNKTQTNEIFDYNFVALVFEEQLLEIASMTKYHYIIIQHLRLKNFRFEISKCKNTACDKHLDVSIAFD